MCKYLVRVKFKCGNTEFSYFDRFDLDFENCLFASEYAKELRTWLNVHDKNASQLVVAIDRYIDNKNCYVRELTYLSNGKVL